MVDAFREVGCPCVIDGSSVDGLLGVFQWIDGISALMTPGPPFVPSSVVFRRAILPSLKFCVTFRRAGEDVLAWWDLLVRSSVIMFVREPTVVYGKGVSIWSSSTIGSPAHLVRLADEIKLRRRVISEYPVADPDRRVFRQAIRERRAIALESILHMMRRGNRDFLQELTYLLRSDPACVASWLVQFPLLLLGKRGHKRIK